MGWLKTTNLDSFKILKKGEGENILLIQQDLPYTPSN